MVHQNTQTEAMEALHPSKVPDYTSLITLTPSSTKIRGVFRPSVVTPAQTMTDWRFCLLSTDLFFQSNVFLVYSQNSVILSVTDTLNSEKVLISEQFRELHATPDLIQQNFTSSQPFSFFGI